MLVVSNKNFKEEVLDSKVPVLVDFYAEWCMPCKMFGPVFESTAEEFEDKVKFVKINIDESPELAQKYFVMSIPTLKLVDGEELKGSYVGAMPQDDLEDWVNDRI
jgi:thioredoxin 1